MASPGPGRAVVATANGRVQLVVAGAAPVEIADAGSRVRQITAGPTVAEDGQLFMLRDDGSVARLTLLPGGGTDVRELPRHSDPGNLALYVDGAGEVNTLLAGDPTIEVISVCHTPVGAPPLMTVRLDGTPLLAQWSGGLIEPVGGVDSMIRWAGAPSSARRWSWRCRRRSAWCLFPLRRRSPGRSARGR
nr:hypothetical protein [Corynebacterium xerosis]